MLFVLQDSIFIIDLNHAEIFQDMFFIGLSLV